jgi:hypothetical protein
MIYVDDNDVGDDMNKVMQISYYGASFQRPGCTPHKLPL